MQKFQLHIIMSKKQSLTTMRNTFSVTKTYLDARYTWPQRYVERNFNYVSPSGVPSRVGTLTVELSSRSYIRRCPRGSTIAATDTTARRLI